MTRMIRQKRIDRGWTLDYVAKQIGLTKASVHDIETGRRSPSYDVLVKLEDLFSLTHRELFASAPDTPNPAPTKASSGAATPAEQA